MIVAGVVDKLILEFERRVFDTPELGRKWMDDFLKKVVFLQFLHLQDCLHFPNKVSIVRKSYQGAHSLEGNQSSEFLKKVDKLELALLQESDLVKLAGLPYIEVLRAFRAVQEACFGLDLKPDYKEKIQKFSKLYRDLGISVTPKVFIK